MMNDSVPKLASYGKLIDLQNMLHEGLSTFSAHVRSE